MGSAPRARGRSGERTRGAACIKRTPAGPARERRGIPCSRSQLYMRRSRYTNVHEMHASSLQLFFHMSVFLDILSIGPVPIDRDDLLPLRSACRQTSWLLGRWTRATCSWR